MNKRILIVGLCLMLGAFTIACYVTLTGEAKTAPAQVSAGLSMYVKSVYASANGSVAITYEASRAGTLPVTGTAILDANEINTHTDEINRLVILHARILTDSPDAETVTLYGGAVKQERVMPGFPAK
jgi:hypothetical protein